MRSCLLALIVCLGLCVGEAAPAGGMLSPEEGRAYIAATDDLFVLDVRNPDELVSGVYPGALNIPVKDLEARLSEIPAGRSVLIYCARGVRAQRAYDLIRAKRPDIAPLSFIRGEPLFEPLVDQHNAKPK